MNLIWNLASSTMLMLCWISLNHSPLERGCTTKPVPKRSLQMAWNFHLDFGPCTQNVLRNILADPFQIEATHDLQCNGRKVQCLVFNNFLLALASFSFWEEDWTLDYNYMRVFLLWLIIWFSEVLCRLPTPQSIPIYYFY